MHCTANCTLVFVVNDDPKRAEVFLRERLLRKLVTISVGNSEALCGFVDAPNIAADVSEIPSDNAIGWRCYGASRAGQSTLPAKVTLFAASGW